MAAVTQQLAQALYEAVKESKKTDRDAVIERFLVRLQKQGDLSKLDRIVEAVTDMEDQELGLLRVQATTAHKEAESTVKEAVTELLGSKEITLEIKTDQELLGGMIVETKNERWDLSLSRRLSELKESLM